MASTTWVPDLLDTYFEAKANQGREVAGGATWRASRLGWCLRAQYLESVLKQPGKPVDARTARVFEVGHLTARMLGEAFTAAGVLLHEELPLHSEELDLGGHVDFVVGGKVKDDGGPTNWALLSYFGDAELPTVGIELKSKQSKSFWWAKKKGEPVADAGQTMQAACYSLLANQAGLHINRWVVLSVSKDDLTMAETPVTFEDEDQALIRLEQLNRAKREGDPLSLPCVCLTGWGGKMKLYCGQYDQFSDTCCEVRS